MRPKNIMRNVVLGIDNEFILQPSRPSRLKQLFGVFLAAVPTAAAVHNKDGLGYPNTVIAYKLPWIITSTFQAYQASKCDQK